MTTEQAIHQHRKDEHLSLALKQWKNEELKATGLTFEDIRLLPSFSELSLDDISLSQQQFGESFDFPFYIEAMTGGSDKGNAVNRQLAEVARNQGIALAVGSQSIALKFPELAEGFREVRQLNPDGFLFANIGAGHDLEHAKRAVSMLDANALEIHVNIAQELAMKENEGDRAFYWLDNIQKIAAGLDVPVIVKEVGFGISPEMLRQLNETEIMGINLGGKSGTNFAWIEHERGGELDLSDFGLTTVESLLAAETPKTKLATGGIRSAEQIFKAQLLGADLVSSAGYILKTLMTTGLEGLEAELEQWKKDLKKFYILQGFSDLEELKKSKKFILSPQAEQFSNQIKNF